MWEIQVPGFPEANLRRVTPHQSGTMFRTVKENEKTPLDLEQVASVCCVSTNRVKRWIEKRGLKALSHNDVMEIQGDDLVDFLVQYNMPIPESILPLKAKKILFIFSAETLEYIYVTFLINFFHKLRKEENFISDSVSYGKNAEYKILTFTPDLIITDTIGDFDNAIDVINFARNIGEIKLLSIIDKNADEKIKQKIMSAGADAVVSRCIDINELVEQAHSLFR